MGIRTEKKEYLTCDSLYHDSVCNSIHGEPDENDAIFCCVPSSEKKFRKHTIDITISGTGMNAQISVNLNFRESNDASDMRIMHERCLFKALITEMQRMLDS